MNEAIATILKRRLLGMSMSDKVGGLVRPITIRIGDKNLTYPVAHDVTHSDCVKGRYNDLMPNSKYKSLMYFEDGGVTFTKREGGNQHGIGNLKLIGWINGQKFQHTECPTPLSSCMVMEVIAALPETIFNEDNLQRIHVDVMGEQVKSNAIFNQYTFDESFSQYLMYPFDYFALNIRVNFTINVNCLCWK